MEELLLLDNPTVAVEAEISENLHRTMRKYLEQNPAMDVHKTFQLALSLFLTPRVRHEEAIDNPQQLAA